MAFYLLHMHYFLKTFSECEQGQSVHRTDVIDKTDKLKNTVCPRSLN